MSKKGKHKPPSYIHTQTKDLLCLQIVQVKHKLSFSSRSFLAFGPTHQRVVS